MGTSHGNFDRLTSSRLWEQVGTSQNERKFWELVGTSHFEIIKNLGNWTGTSHFVQLRQFHDFHQF